MFTPTHTQAAARLTRFAPLAGRDYAQWRNYDDMAHISALSPYIRHRIVTEADVIRAVLAQHSPQAAEKFIQEVFWRSYWKGWLEQRPAIWHAYLRDLDQARNDMATQAGLRRAWQDACLGQTGIDCFDHWAQQLVQTGYLHNHARMWFASIWIYTLGLPWTLGADFFLRHLLDGDPASNTLSWRWVGGMQTMGKTYLARADNIALYTRGRFAPKGLAQQASPLPCPPHPAPRAIPASGTMPAQGRIGLIVTEEDLSLDWLLAQVQPAACAFVTTSAARSPLHIAPMVQDFATGALADCAARYGDRLGTVSFITPAEVASWAQAQEIDHLLGAYTPTGPAQDALQGITYTALIRPYDRLTWPHASHGFFRFKDQIPTFIAQISAAAAG